MICFHCAIDIPVRSQDYLLLLYPCVIPRNEQGYQPEVMPAPAPIFLCKRCVLSLFGEPKTFTKLRKLHVIWGGVNGKSLNPLWVEKGEATGKVDPGSLFGEEEKETEC